MKFQAVISDCYRVLVDREPLENQACVECVADLGLDMVFEEAIGAYKGKKLAECVANVERRFGRSVPDSFITDFRTRSAEVFQARLQPIRGVEGVIETVQALSIPFGVASSGTRKKIEANLTITGLPSYFQGHIVSAYEDGSWKPGPCLFLHAAKTLGAAPKTCAGMEDSLTDGRNDGVWVRCRLRLSARCCYWSPAHSGNERAYCFAAINLAFPLVFDSSMLKQTVNYLRVPVQPDSAQSSER